MLLEVLRVLPEEVCLSVCWLIFGFFIHSVCMYYGTLTSKYIFINLQFFSANLSQNKRLVLKTELNKSLSHGK